MSAELAGTGALVRFVLRRDRFVLAGWVLFMAVLAVGLASGGSAAYPTEAERIAVAESIAANPALLMLRGPVFAPTPGGLAAQGFLSSGVLVSGVVSLLLLIRHTRVEEQTGRRELLGSTVVGRQAPLTAALIVVVAGNLAVAVVSALGLIAIGLPVTGSVAFGLALGAGGIVFAGVGAVAAQLTEGSGGAGTIAVAVLAVCFVVAGVGEVTRSAAVWFSPFGWVRHTRSFAGEQWWVFALFALLATVLVVAAFTLSARRDIGAGLVPARRGPVVGGRFLRSTFALAWRLHRGSVLGWTVGFTFLGTVLGAALRSIGVLFDTPAYRELAASLGGGDAADVFFRLVLYVLAQTATASAVIATLRMRTEETAGLADVLLSGPVNRIRWALGHLVIAVLGTALVLTGLGLGAGLGDPDVLGMTLMYLPACLVFVGLATALTGWAPRVAVPVTWAVLLLVILVDFLGEFRLVDVSVLTFLSPFVAVAGSGAGVVLVGIAGVLVVGGLVGLRRRDVAC
ncbi:ABC transporter permease [Allokutzneria albata]|uniref:ABC-2 type transport system permease protein n=1 Tax=Allokutzneria albata TaxID=211114 RepID=A0A1G9T220_ALLAB|nr:hypothetical protein [Allokutzneria albata]SDM41657.1 ABC-2 type transport system permease protein [Allokutzneria albata]